MEDGANRWSALPQTSGGCGACGRDWLVWVTVRARWTVYRAVRRRVLMSAAVGIALGGLWDPDMLMFLPGLHVMLLGSYGMPSSSPGLGPQTRVRALYRSVRGVNPIKMWAIFHSVRLTTLRGHHKISPEFDVSASRRFARPTGADTGCASRRPRALADHFSRRMRFS